MPRALNYTDEEILLALIWTMPNRLTKGQVGRLLGIKSAGQKHWSTRFERLSAKKLISIDKLDAGDLFHGSPILRYYLAESNLEEIWSQYFIHYAVGGGVNDPFLTPFSSGAWNVTNSPEFAKLVGSKFNYYFLCANNGANPIKPSERLKALGKEKVWKIIDSVLSVGWKTEAYLRKPALLDTLTPEQKKSYKTLATLYDGQIRAHPADYRKFTALFEKSFKYYL